MQNNSCIRKPQVISGGGGGAHPQHPPPRSAPVENPRILWSCQLLISKGSLADRELDLSYGAREVWFWHQICRYYTVCHHVEAYTLGRLSIDGFSFERVAQSNLEWIFSKLDSGFQSLVGFRIPSAGFRIPKPRIPDSTSKKFLDSGIRIPLHGANLWTLNSSIDTNSDVHHNVCRLRWLITPLYLTS